MDRVRDMVIALLDDGYGVPFAGFEILKELCSDENEDIFNVVVISDGRAYLPENWQS